MGFIEFLKTTGLCVAIALVFFAFYGNDLLFLAKALALAIGFSIAFTIGFPYVRGVRKGDKVQINGMAQNMPNFISWFAGRSGLALTNASLNKEIRIRLDDGKEAVGVVESYENLFSPTKVRLLYEEKIVE